MTDRNAQRSTRCRALSAHQVLHIQAKTAITGKFSSMRIKLKIKAAQPNVYLPLNHNHATAALIYRTIEKSSISFAEFLHEEGFVGDHRSFKLFTFSRLKPFSAALAGDKYRLQNPHVELQIGSPITDFVEHFVSGLFQAETFRLANIPFTLETAETLPSPFITECMTFRCLSPITESVRDEQGRIRYLSIDEDWSDLIQRNLIRKYKILHGREPEDVGLLWKWDRNYLEELSTRGKRASALIDIRGIKIRGWLAPFTVEGSRELIEIGYETGFGNRNSMGFGMVEN